MARAASPKPRRTTKAAAIESPEVTPAKVTTKSKDSYTLRIPKISFKEGSLNVYLVFVLVVFAFLLGMLTNKVLYLENQVKNSNTTANAAVAADTQNGATAAPTPPQIVKVDNGHLPILGNSNAKVTVVEFSDFQCPFCKQFEDQTYNQIKSQYIDTGKIKFVYRHFPLTSIHPNAQISAEAAECAQEQNRFWDYHDKLFATQDTWAPQTNADASNSLVGYAGDLGMNTDQFKSCLDTEKYKKNVDDDASAGNTVQVDGTPAFFINGYRLVGAQPFSEFQKVIDQQLKQ